VASHRAYLQPLCRSGLRWTARDDPRLQARFSNIYRRWWGNEARNNHLLADHEDLVLLGPRRDGVDQRAVDGVLADGLLAGMKDPRVRAAMRLTAVGRSQAEIAGTIGVTEKAVERMLYNERIRLKKRMAG
jgi:hypothetical protein